MADGHLLYGADGHLLYGASGHLVNDCEIDFCQAEQDIVATVSLSGGGCNKFQNDPCWSCLGNTVEGVYETSQQYIWDPLNNYCIWYVWKQGTLPGLSVTFYKSTRTFRVMIGSLPGGPEPTYLATGLPSSTFQIVNNRLAGTVDVPGQVHSPDFDCSGCTAHVVIS
jgi:hypothetical protein